ncbi:uncharacterized protein EV420DRAFT_1583891 [Desarmillaria tabescens]|uniref:Uncharacterized protein n=1 Tax=Armillaria tabescens TaxID=1929756 RepID=A0AA39JF69_ARMTA|nr:uncharacterized protein EV420DRAFT_1583891 [Desarmillaria tabescens]KAK0439468.1 hypothetical protein EV420DRAFT_1583891 [Desarmillaria tabescens]
MMQATHFCKNLAGAAAGLGCAWVGRSLVFVFSPALLTLFHLVYFSGRRLRWLAWDWLLWLSMGMVLYLCLLTD